jgi:hypothetical protein
MPECLKTGFGFLLFIVPMVVAFVLPSVLWLVWSERRFKRKWALDRQLREMERAIEEEGLPDEQRAWRQRYREEQATIAREARGAWACPRTRGPEWSRRRGKRA